MLFPSSRPHRMPESTTDSQYDTTTGYSSSSYTKRPKSGAKPDYCFGRNGNNPSSRQSSRRRNNQGNEPLSNILNQQYSPSPSPPPPTQDSIYSTVNPQRPTINYLIP